MQVNGSVIATITNRAEISTDDGADVDSTPDTTNGTNTESTVDNEVNNGTGDEDDHDRADITVAITLIPVDGVCAYTGQTFYSGVDILPPLTGLCTS